MIFSVSAKTAVMNRLCQSPHHDDDSKRLLPLSRHDRSFKLDVEAILMIKGSQYYCSLTVHSRFDPTQLKMFYIIPL